MTESYWIYHERQEAALCGQHALNNLIQEPVFTAQSLAEVAHQLDAIELSHLGDVNSPAYLQKLAEGSGNVDDQGNFSIQVLNTCLQNQYGITLTSIQHENLSKLESTEVEGFICNKDSHWFAIRKINGIYWNLDSMKDKPEAISHFRLAATIQALKDAGYSVFVPEGEQLPRPWKGTKHGNTGAPEYWWKESTLREGRNVINGASDPWAKVGKGNLLREQNLDELSDEELLSLAVAKSLQPNSSSVKIPELSREPGKDETGVITLQLKLPDGKRVVRRFREIEPLGMIHAVVIDKCGKEDGKVLELKAGFPPKILDEKTELKSLKGASVTCRWV